MNIPWLTDEISFPHPELTTPEGVLCLGGDLSPDRLLFAYQNGIFPWFNEEDPIIWWSPNPRFVLYPKEIKIKKSMRTYFNNPKYQLTINENFEGVIDGCANTKRGKQESIGTWITSEMRDSFIKLHVLGYAHSVEVWQKGNLVGGLYGLGLGKVFFGESMFSIANNASKFGFISLVKKLSEAGFNLVDCQIHSNHLESLGAKMISRQEFLKVLEKNLTYVDQNQFWDKLSF